MSDLVERLRERHSFLCDEAAEEIARLRELLRDIGGFSTHYVKPEWRNKWAQNLDLIDAALAGAAVQPNVAHYPIEFGPSDARRLECACGNPAPGHANSASGSFPTPGPQVCPRCGVVENAACDHSWHQLAGSTVSGDTHE